MLNRSTRMYKNYQVKSQNLMLFDIIESLMFGFVCCFVICYLILCISMPKSFKFYLILNECFKKSRKSCIIKFEQQINVLPTAVATQTCLRCAIKTNDRPMSPHKSDNPLSSLLLYALWHVFPKSYSPSSSQSLSSSVSL